MLCNKFMRGFILFDYLTLINPVGRPVREIELQKTGDVEIGSQSDLFVK